MIIMEVEYMRDNYDIMSLNPRRNPYVKKKMKKQISINIDEDVIDYFKDMANDTGIPYQILMNKCLSHYAAQKLKAEINWK